MAKAVYEISDILRILPHRFPFLLVDRVEVLDRDLKAKNRVGWKIRAIKNVTFNEPFFSGHFPHRPVMPGVLQIEAMAQAGCLAVVDPDGPEMDVAIAGVNEARFRRPVVPGDRMVLTAEITKDRGQIMMLRCQCHVDGELASEAEMIAKVFLKGT
jgi:beta-hydroxyacyl-ACP dehydratase FabZ